jgi:hypothetical protein
MTPLRGQAQPTRPPERSASGSAAAARGRRPSSAPTRAVSARDVSIGTARTNDPQHRPAADAIAELWGAGARRRARERRHHRQFEPRCDGEIVLTACVPPREPTLKPAALGQAIGDHEVSSKWPTLVHADGDESGRRADEGCDRPTSSGPQLGKRVHRSGVVDGGRSIYDQRRTRAAADRPSRGEPRAATGTGSRSRTPRSIAVRPGR